jgi:hypothetical protein
MRLEVKWIIPVVAVVLGLGVVLTPWWSSVDHWNRCMAPMPMGSAGPHPFCGQEPGPDWLAGLVVGIVVYFVLAGIVVAQRALEKK